ncbi:hypothetical protein DYB25_013610 [Aphanomyces astaci]|uniref:Uncharacterized protein n=1 Tax=Aphanomyces astaci TaxID=112090 RepID=A0A396ZUH6_APHAT|nr:hypothetical protein DYB25_013610 [Aphanomyces astaci]RHZ35052.1 hypothetical protein DYB26_012523 [Aphanomyces astaci]
MRFPWRLSKIHEPTLALKYATLTSPKGSFAEENFLSPSNQVRCLGQDSLEEPSANQYVVLDATTIGGLGVHWYWCVNPWTVLLIKMGEVAMDSLQLGKSRRKTLVNIYWFDCEQLLGR